MTAENLVDVLADDNFSDLDRQTWSLTGDASYTGTAVRLNRATTDTTGRLNLRSGVSENFWDCTFAFDIQASTGGEDITLGFYADEITNNEPQNGYHVELNHETDTISLIEYEGGQTETLTSSPVTITEERHVVDIHYIRGRVTVRLDNARIFDHTIEDPLDGGDKFYFLGDTSSSVARHIVDDIRIVQRGRRNVAAARRQWDSGGIEIGQGTNTYHLMRALVSDLDRVDFDLSEAYRSHHINTARGNELDKFGDLVQLDRKSGESDDKYRARLKVQFRVGNIGTTFDEFSQLTAELLDTEIDNIEFQTALAADPATAVVSADPTIYDNAALSRQEVAEFLGEAVPAGHEVSALERGTFRLKEDGDTDDADAGLTSDTISTGGTLASDIV